MSHKLVPWSVSVAAFGLIITSDKAQGSWKITLVYFIHAQDGSLVSLNIKCLHRILNIYILPALLLSAITEVPESIASKLLGSNTVNNIFASTWSSRCVVLPCSFTSLKLAHLSMLYIHHIYLFEYGHATSLKWQVCLMKSNISLFISM